MMKYLRILKSMLREDPILLIFDVTRRCNQRCRMCNIWREQSEDMSVDEIRIMAKHLRDRGMGYVFLQGGEPTLRSDLIDIVDTFLACGIKPTVITNGILLRGLLSEQLAARPCNVAVSLDSMNPDVFKLIRGVDAFAKVTENIREAAKIRKRKGNWSVTSTITAVSTLEDIQMLEHFAAECGFMYAIRPYIHVSGAAGKRDDALAYGDITPVVQIFEYMRDQAQTSNYLASVVYDEHLRYVRREPQPMCDALIRSIVMSPMGNFAPCIEFTGESAPLDEMYSKKADWLKRCAECNRDTPCFYNDAREIGILWRKKQNLALAFPRIIMQMIKYGNFF
jgi:MoaA/NifB/PqqE/SkfB family radical SAM enzyme